MLPKKNRLTTYEVGDVQKNGKVIRAHGFSIRYTISNFTAARSAKIGTKFAVVVSKKVDPSSVERHKIKRSVYAALQKSCLDSSKNTSHVAITVLFPHTEMARADTYGAIVGRVRELLM